MAYCGKCGAELQGNTVFCGECGTKVEAEKTEDNFAYREADSVPQIAVGNLPENGRVQRCADGKFRWIYEFSLLRNPGILFTIMKVLALCSCAPALIVTLSGLGDEGVEAFMSGAQVLGVLLLIMVPLSLLSYFILAALYGWKYIVLFEMDEKGVIHIQQDKQFKKAQGIAWINMFLGAAGNKSGMTGRGLALMTKNSTSSEFARVKKVTFKPSRNTIKLDQPFAHNQVYVDNADWEFVRDYIEKRCKSAKIK